MGAEMLALMTALGHRRFAVVGHDRGARVAYRLALDHPEAVAKLVVLDILPTAEYWDLADRTFAVNTFHWGFLARDGGLPERLIGKDPEFFQDYLMRLWAGDYGALDPEALKEYRRCFAKPENIAASCADYRAGYGIDDAARPRRPRGGEEDHVSGPGAVRRPVSLDRRESGRRHLEALGHRRARQRDPERPLRGGGEAAGSAGGAGCRS